MLEARMVHLDVTAPLLAVGVEYIEQTLGVVPQAGGSRPPLETHNLLQRLGPML